MAVVVADIVVGSADSVDKAADKQVVPKRLEEITKLVNEITNIEISVTRKLKFLSVCQNCQYN